MNAPIITTTAKIMPITEPRPRRDCANAKPWAVAVAAAVVAHVVLPLLVLLALHDHCSSTHTRWPFWSYCSSAQPMNSRWSEPLPKSEAPRHVSKGLSFVDGPGFPGTKPAVGQSSFAGNTAAPVNCLWAGSSLCSASNPLATPATSRCSGLGVLPAGTRRHDGLCRMNPVCTKSLAEGETLDPYLA